jgi:hypothetical protein
MAMIDAIEVRKRYVDPMSFWIVDVYQDAGRGYISKMRRPGHVEKGTKPVHLFKRHFWPPSDTARNQFQINSKSFFNEKLLVRDPSIQQTPQCDDSVRVSATRNVCFIL